MGENKRAAGQKRASPGQPVECCGHGRCSRGIGTVRGTSKEHY